MKKNWGEKKRKVEKKRVRNNPQTAPPVLDVFLNTPKQLYKTAKYAKQLYQHILWHQILYACMSCLVLQCHPVEAILYFRYTDLLVEEIIYFLVSALKDPSNPALMLFLLIIKNMFLFLKAASSCCC